MAPRSSLSLIAAMIVWLLGACSTSGVGSRPSGPPTFDPAAGSVVLRLDLTDAGVDGIRGRSTVLVLGDGAVIRSEGDGYERLRLAPGGVDELLRAAGAAGLLDEVDFGEPGVSDMGWQTMTVTASGRTVKHRVYAPGWDQGLSGRELAARQAFSGFADRLLTLDGLAVDAGPTAFVPDRVVLQATRVPPPVGEVTEPEPTAWPLTGTPFALLGDTGCAVVSGPTAPSLVAVAHGDRTPSFVVDSGAKVPALLRVSVTIRLPGDIGCPDLPAVPDPLPAPFPGDDRQPGQMSDFWVAGDAVDRAADSGRLGAVSTRARASHYQLTVAVVSDAGREVIDVVGEPYSSGPDRGAFALRVDRSSGEILAVTSE